MSDRPNIPEIDAEIPSKNAVSLYGQEDAMDDFPVLKAFQQYVDAEQAKARKRLVSLGIFFGILMGAVIAVFLVMLMNISERNQSLNDRLIEFAMKDRERQAPVVVQPPVQQDNSALLSLTTKLEEMQKKLVESEKKAEAAERAQKAAAEAIAAAATPKPPSPEQLEIARLKGLLAAEIEKAAAEKAKQKEAELEEYRRKHYPELYRKEEKGMHSPSLSPKTKKKIVVAAEKEDDDDTDIDAILNEAKAHRYFDDEETEEEAPRPIRMNRSATSSAKPPSRDVSEKEQPPAKDKVTLPPKARDYFSIPVDVKGSAPSTSSWRVPMD